MRENRLVTQRDSVDVLLVEDDPADALMTQEALAQSAVTVHLHVAVDGEQALRFLRKTHEFGSAPKPSLVMLDLNLPRRGGLEVLAEMKTDSDLLPSRWSS
jgi:CheY-like chemotaxis protein